MKRVLPVLVVLILAAGGYLLLAKPAESEPCQEHKLVACEHERAQKARARESSQENADQAKVSQRIHEGQSLTEATEHVAEEDEKR
jgi:hypothetical protein